MNKSKLVLILMMTIMGQVANAAITCETPRGAKVLEIHSQSVSIKHPFKMEADRAVASLNGARTKLQGSGFTKVLYHNGEKHIIYVKDRNNFSNLEDYLIVRSSEGHEMTYPLECSN